jgi:leucyl/phenylalanyl-tRNA--protein transferase
MPVFRLPEDIRFPPPQLAREDGLLAVGGDLSASRLLLAYRMGIFPWFSEEDPLLWWSPDPRLVLFPQDLRAPRRLRRLLRSGRFSITVDTAFEEVITACARTRLAHDEPTWIDERMIHAYTRLHREGYAHSVEAWQEGHLAGGLYGVSLGNCFFGESMFTRVSNASKAAFVTLVDWLQRQEFEIIDCQVTTAHLKSMGAVEIPRSWFLALLARALKAPDRRGAWHFQKKE